MQTEILAIALGLGSAAAWGAGDFSGGCASRKGNLLGVILISQFGGGVLLILMGLLFSEKVPPSTHLFYGFLAGIFGSLGLIALYKGLAQGRMGIVAPLSAVLTALVPIGYSMRYEGLPTATQLLGFGCFLAAIWLLSSGNGGLRMTMGELLLSMIAGVGFGLFFIFIDQANDLSIFWPLVGAKFGSVSVLVVMVLMGGKPARPLSGQWVFIGMTSVLDATGNVLFSMAAHMGRLDVAAVLGSLYPAATVLLAWVFLKERLHRRQWMGVAGAFFALILISL